MKDSGWNRDGNTILNHEPVLHQLVERNSEVKSGLDGREMDQGYLLWVDLPVHHPVTDSLLSPIERVGSWVYPGLSDGLTDAQKRLIWLDTWSKGPRGWVAWQSPETPVVRIQEMVWRALRVLRLQGESQIATAGKKTLASFLEGLGRSVLAWSFGRSGNGSPCRWMEIRALVAGAAVVVVESAERTPGRGPVTW